MKKNRKPSKRSKQLFDPTEIVTTIRSALVRDFKEAQHVYCLNDSVTLYAFNRQVSEFTKKFTTAGPDKDRLTEEAFDRFRSVNAHMKETNSLLRDKLRFTSPRVLNSLPFDEKIHLRARALARSVLGQLDMESWFSECKNSGGTSLGVPYRDTSEENKFRYPMSATKHAKRIFELYLGWDLSLAQSIVEHNDGFPVGDVYNIVDSSRATTVDKSDVARRFIAIEPTVNMYLQQGLMQLMYNRLADFGLDVTFLPDRHKVLARYGSIHRLTATIDWSSASDCVSIELLRWLLPPEWFRAVSLVRSPNVAINGTSEELHMISSMGNATTFPLETLVFWTYAVAMHVTLNTDSNSLFPEWEDLRVCSVFGDDCIVPSNMAIQYMEFMTGLGFIVNKDKSCYGPMQFRESCGGDYLNGYDIRPYFVKAPSSTRLSALEPWLYIITNSLLKKYKQYFGELAYVYDKELWRVIFALFSRYNIKIKLVPSDFPDDSGLKIAHDIVRFHRHYPIRLSRIAKSQHGTYTFNFCKFQYKETSKWNETLRYSLKLKKFTMSIRPPLHETPIRRLGGYVVGKGITSHWDVPRVERGS